jgi:hypothetical protein
VESVGTRAQAEFVASVRRPIPRRHVVAAIALGIVLILVMAFGTRGGSSPPLPGSTYTTVADHQYSGLVLDGIEYLQMADAHHDGHRPWSKVGPFTARWLVPTIAGLLPLDAGAAIQLVNVTLLVAGMACLTLLVSGWVRHSTTLVAAVVLFSVAVPVLQFAGGLVVDAAAVGLVSIGIWAAYRLPLWAALAVLAVGVMAKESALILVAFGITLEMVRGAGARARWTRAALWCATGAAACLVTSHVGSSARLTFMPWLPHDIHYLGMTLRINVSRGDNWLLTGLTLVVPIVSIVIAIWTVRRHWFRIARIRLAPLAVGVCVAILLSVWAATAAWWDTRSAWMALPFGVPVAALLIDQVLDRGIRASSRNRRVRRIVLGAGAGGFACLLVAALVSAALGPFRAYRVDPDAAPRLTAALRPDTRSVRHHGRGSARLAVPRLDDGRPVVLDVDVPNPRAVRISVSGASQPLFSSRLDRSGTFLVDPQSPRRTVTITVDGPWTARFRSLDTLSSWGPFASLSGHGPNVVLVPDANPFSVKALFMSSARGSHFQLVGGACHVPDCPDERAGELPIGLQMLVVSDPGNWSVIPQHAHQQHDAVRLSDLD